jgi:hypothetical protein
MGQSGCPRIVMVGHDTIAETVDAKALCIGRRPAGPGLTRARGEARAGKLANRSQQCERQRQAAIFSQSLMLG